MFFTWVLSRRSAYWPEDFFNLFFWFLHYYSLKYLRLHLEDISLIKALLLFRWNIHYRWEKCTSYTLLTFFYLRVFFIKLHTMQSVIVKINIMKKTKITYFSCDRKVKKYSYLAQSSKLFWYFYFEKWDFRKIIF